MIERKSLPIGLYDNVIEAGCDEAGRGCLAGPVFAAAVILPSDFQNEELNDSKKLTPRKRYELRTIIEREALAYAVATSSVDEVDEMNVLWASVKAMHRALRGLSICPEHILVDGNHFLPFKEISHTCVVRGDGKYLSIAAASILAKTYRDDYMAQLHEEYPEYDWKQNKGYPTRLHRESIELHGVTDHHRKSFKIQGDQLKLKF